MSDHVEPLFERSGNILATPGLRLKPPWFVGASKRLKGRYFFYNSNTKETTWTLNPSLLIERRAPTAAPEKDRNVLPNIGLRGAAADSNMHSLIQSPIQSPGRRTTPPQKSASSSELDTVQTNLSRSSLKVKSAPNFPASGQTNDAQAGETYIDSDSLVVIGGLGNGGYSDIVQVKHVKTNDEFAMKVISKKRVGNTRKSRDRLVLELWLMTETAPSPFVQRCHASFESPTNIFFVLDLLLGSDLYTHLAFERAGQVGLPERECRIVLAELALALKHVHNLGFLHKDIKLENVMLDHRGHVKLVDFGLAEAIKTKVGPIEMAGSVASLPPELIREQTGGRHTDWWSFGIVSYDLITGCTPWSSTTDERVIKRDILHLPIALPGDISDHAIEFLDGLLQRDYCARLGFHSDHEVLCAKFFEGIDWEATARLECAPAFLPGEDVVDKATRQEAIESYMSRPEVPAADEEVWYLGLMGIAKHPRFHKLPTLPVV